MNTPVKPSPIAEYVASELAKLNKPRPEGVQRYIDEEAEKQARAEEAGRQMLQRLGGRQ